MWELINTTPFAAERTWVRDHEGGELWVVVVKASYTILPDGGLQLCREQADVTRSPVYSGEPGKSPLYEDSETERRKPGWDLILHGTARVPEGHPVRRHRVSVGLGGWRKSIDVFGNRQWRRSGSQIRLSEPEPFEAIALSYVNAFGGADPDRPEVYYAPNPVGRGFAEKAEKRIGLLAPNLQMGGDWLDDDGAPPRPAGFGPIDRWWSPRAGRAGTFGLDWERHRRPLLPGDYDERHEHSAPDDQQFARPLIASTTIEIEGMTAAGAERLQLPRLAFGLRTDFGMRSVDHRAELQSIVIDMDKRLMKMVHRSQLPCTHRETLRLKSTYLWERRRLGAQDST
jgi:hypothetical protein